MDRGIIRHDSTVQREVTTILHEAVSVHQKKDPDQREARPSGKDHPEYLLQDPASHRTRAHQAGAEDLTEIRPHHLPVHGNNRLEEVAGQISAVQEAGNLLEGKDQIRAQRKKVMLEDLTILGLPHHRGMKEKDRPIGEALQQTIFHQLVDRDRVERVRIQHRWNASPGRIKR